MKSASPELLARLAQGTTSICRLWAVTPNGRATLYFTDHQRKLTVGGEVYRADTPFTATAIKNSVGGGNENVDVEVILDDLRVSYADTERGIYDNAAVVLSLVDYNALDAGALPLFVGEVHSINIPHKRLGQFALRGTRGRMLKQLNEVYQPGCRADFGDSRCGVNLGAYSADLTVTGAVGPRSFSAALAGAPAGRYALGSLLWTSGKNLGVAIEVTTNTANTVELMFKPPFPIEAGDTATIYRGCPKTLLACMGYNNLPNYRGEPYVPGDDFIKTTRL